MFHKLATTIRTIFALLALTYAVPVFGQTTTVQGTAADGATAKGNPVQIGGKDAAGKVQALAVGPAGTLSTATVVTTGAPTFTLSCTTVSSAATGLTASTCFRLACNGTAFWRTGTATPTALTTDAGFYGPAAETICLPSTDTALACVTASGTTACTGTTVVP